VGGRVGVRGQGPPAAACAVEGSNVLVGAVMNILNVAETPADEDEAEAVKSDRDSF